MSYTNQPGNSLGKALQRERKHQESPVLSNIESGVYLAITTGQVDPEGRGRLAAYVPTLGGNPDEPMFFQYASPFGGSNKGGNYGMFASPPDAGVTILVLFAENGDLSQGFWFAVAQQVSDVVAGGAAGKAKEDGSGMGGGVHKDVPAAKSTPTTKDELFEKPDDEVDNNDRNVNVANQGLYSDGVRGYSTASPRRDPSYEIPKHSSVYGWKTPGNNAITIDDGSVSPDGAIHPNQIRIQTGQGASVILDGTNDTIYAVNSKGSGWVEIGAEGEVMVYAEGSVSMRAEKDFNVRADRNINMEAVEHVNIKAGNSFHVNAGNQAHIKSDGSQFYDSAGSTHIKVGSNMYASTGALMHLNGPQAAASPGISTVSHPDIQNLESTQVNDSIVSTMPSHEPMTRKNVGEFAGVEPGSPASEVQSDPSSTESQADAPLSDEPIPEIGDETGLATVRSRTGVSTQVAAVFQKNFQGLIDDLDAMGYEIKQLGGYVNRNARGASRPSFHAMGAAIDINWNQNGYSSTVPAGWNPRTSRAPQYKCDLPSNIGEIAARHGLGWGGNWSRPWDPMHFSMASAERGSVVLTRAYKVADQSLIKGTKAVRLA